MFYAKNVESRVNNIKKKESKNVNINVFKDEININNEIKSATKIIEFANILQKLI